MKRLSLIFTMLIILLVNGNVYAETLLDNTNSSMQGSKVKVHESQIPGYFKYINGRYAFSIEFPQTLYIAFAPANSDGATFTLPDGQAQLRISGGWNSVGATTTQEYVSDMQRVEGEIGYSAKGDDWYVITWKSNRMIYYQKTFISNRYRNSFVFVYPASENYLYEEVITNLENTFTPGWKTGYKIWG